MSVEEEEGNVVFRRFGKGRTDLAGDLRGFQVFFHGDRGIAIVFQDAVHRFCGVVGTIQILFVPVIVCIADQKGTTGAFNCAAGGLEEDHIAELTPGLGLFSGDAVFVIYVSADAEIPGGVFVESGDGFGKIVSAIRPDGPECAFSVRKVGFGGGILDFIPLGFVGAYGAGPAQGG